MKSIQISFNLFWELYRYFVGGHGDVEQIREQIEEKANRIADRELYTKYKTAATEEEREKARLAYLDSKCVPDEFRY